MKTLDEVLAAVGGEDARESIALDWDESQKEYPEGGPAMLSEAFVRENAAIGGFTVDDIELLVNVAEKIRLDECLSRYFWHAYWRNYLSPDRCPPNGLWPEPAVLGEYGGMLFVLVGIAVVPLIRKNHERLGITGAVTSTGQQIARYCYDNYRRGNNGRYGIYFPQLGWLRLYTEKPYVRLGRLEFLLSTAKNDFVVYRNSSTGQTLALAPDGARYSADGYRVPAACDAPGCWNATLTVTEGEVTGNPIAPEGHVERKVVTLSSDWQKVLGQGDICLDMHIPSGGGLTLDLCRDAFVQARDFFRKFFPNSVPKAIVCRSWIFNPQLDIILGYDANLPKFQRELYLVPTQTNPTDGLWFIYLQAGTPDPATWPQKTSLQRKVMKYITDGGQWRAGGMFFLMEDVDSFGTQIYRKSSLR